MLQIVKKWGREDLAWVYLAQIRGKDYIEFVESLTPPLSRSQKWVLIVSTLLGCPVQCKMCDAGRRYRGRLTRSEIFAQIDAMVLPRWQGRKVPVEKWKIQFCRMGEPTFNSAVLEVLRKLPETYDAKGLLPSLSSIAPQGVEKFWRELTAIKRDLYSGDHFQLQFSLHSTDPEFRNWLIPVRKWGFAQIARFGESFYQPGDRKITLNFALAQEAPFDATILYHYFSPEIFCLKFTPLNPTLAAHNHNLSSFFSPQRECASWLEELRQMGYQVILSFGEWEENHVGSNCGQYVQTFLQSPATISAYTFAQKDSTSASSTPQVEPANSNRGT